MVDEFFVYFLKCEQFVKIGSTNNLHVRIRELQIGSPFNLELVGIHRFSSRVEAREREKLLHLKFHLYLERGEWFMFNDFIKSYISQRKKNG